MPFRSETGGFVGNGNMGDFIDVIVETFLTDPVGSGGLGWTSHTHTGSPARSKGASPDFEFLFSRGGGSPATVPVWGMQTNSKTLRIYSGSGIDTTEASFDQPGNPVNEPPADPPSDPSAGGTVGSERCLRVTTAVGSYDGYWVFGGASAEYCHVVLKVGAREYRHFHCGLLNPLVDDLPPESFYVTGHAWAWLSPDDLKTTTIATNSNNQEHQPYDVAHRLPFSNCSQTNTASGIDVRACGNWFYIPNYGTEGYSWWLGFGATSQGGTAGGGSGTDILGMVQNTNQPGNVRSITTPTKSVGVVNTNLNSPLDVKFGAGGVSGGGDSFGMIPFQCEPTYTTDGVALIPIYVYVCSDFASALRWSPVAQIPDVYRVNMKSLDAEEEITIGSDTYVVFPMINKDANNTVAGEGYSGYEGLAYKKITANAT